MIPHKFASWDGIRSSFLRGKPSPGGRLRRTDLAEREEVHSGSAME